jgi:hypothetical protein
MRIQAIYIIFFSIMLSVFQCTGMDKKLNQSNICICSVCGAEHFKKSLISPLSPQNSFSPKPKSILDLIDDLVEIAERIQKKINDFVAEEVMAECDAIFAQQQVIAEDRTKFMNLVDHLSDENKQYLLELLGVPKHTHDSSQLLEAIKKTWDRTVSFLKALQKQEHDLNMQT